jgi:hypothetical protein
MHSVCIIEVHVTVDNITILSAAYKLLLWHICVTANSATYIGLHVKCLLFCPIFTKLEASEQIFIKVPSSKFHGAIPIQVNGQTDSRDEAHRRF